MKEAVVDNVLIQMGQNSSENSALVKITNPKYTWIHLNSFPSPHVVVHSENPSHNVLVAASSMCVNGSKYKNMKDLYFSRCKIENLRCTEKLGEVVFKSNRKVLKYKIKFSQMSNG